MFKQGFAAALTLAVAAADNMHDDMKVAGIVEGFFIGAFDFHGMTDIGHCISDANPVEQHFENAMRGFWNGSYQEVVKAIDQLGLAVSDIGDMLDHCGKIDHHDYEQIQRMAEAFLHPKQLLLEATESLIVNGVNIFEDTREGLHDYRMGHWLDAGEHFGQAAAMLLYGKTQMVDHEELFYDFDNHWQELLDQIDHEKDEKMHHFEAMKSSNVHFTFFRMGKILEGLLAGSVEAEVPHGVECLRDAKHIWERFGGVIDQLQAATFNSVLHAVEDLGHVIHDIANELEECKATVGTDLDKLREMSKAFTDPWYFIFHIEHDLIVNGQDIHHEVMDAEAQWENQHFYEFGHSVGLALSKIFLGGQMKNGISPVFTVPAHKLSPAHTALEPVDEYMHYYDPRFNDNKRDNKSDSPVWEYPAHILSPAHTALEPVDEYMHYYDPRLKKSNDISNKSDSPVWEYPAHILSPAHTALEPVDEYMHYYDPRLKDAKKDNKSDSPVWEYPAHILSPAHTALEPVDEYMHYYDPRFNDNNKKDNKSDSPVWEYPAHILSPAHTALEPVDEYMHYYDPRLKDAKKDNKSDSPVWEYPAHILSPAHTALEPVDEYMHYYDPRLKDAKKDNKSDSPVWEYPAHILSPAHTALEPVDEYMHYYDPRLKKDNETPVEILQ